MPLGEDELPRAPVSSAVSRSCAALRLLARPGLALLSLFGAAAWPTVSERRYAPQCESVRSRDHISLCAVRHDVCGACPVTRVRPPHIGQVGKRCRARVSCGWAPETSAPKPSSPILARARTHKPSQMLTWMCRPTSVIGAKADMARTCHMSANPKRTFTREQATPRHQWQATGRESRTSPANK
jgi:hypothetical protein